MTAGDEAVREAEAVAGIEPHRPNGQLSADKVEWLFREAGVLPDATELSREHQSFMAAAMGDPEASAAWADPEATDDHQQSLPEPTPRRTLTADRPEFVTYLPECAGCRDWGGLHPQGEADPDLSVDAVRERTTQAIADAYRRHDHVLIDALPGTGKTFGTFLAAARRGEPVTYLAPRVDLYEQAAENAKENGLSAWTLPSATRDCPTFTGEHGEDVAGRVAALVYGRGLTPKAVHDALDLPCEAGDRSCPYRAKWRGFDPDHYDVLIGHYNHGHLPPVVKGRHVVIDEWPGETFWTTLEGDRLHRAVDAFCQRHADDDWPFSGYRDCLRGRDDPDALEAARAWFAATPPAVDDRAVLDTPGYHAHSPHATYAVLFGTLGDADYPLGRTTIPAADGASCVAVFEDSDGDPHADDRVDIQTGPSLRYANAIVGLDGTPTPDGTEWDLALGLPEPRRLTPRRVLGDAERRDFLADTQRLTGIVANDNPKPYSSGTYVTHEQDAALFEAVASEYGPPVVLTTKAAREQYEASGTTWTDPVDAFDHFGNLRGTNRYADHRSAVVSGSTHYGDRWVRRWAAMNGDEIHPEGRGANRDYGPAAGFVYAMREAQVAQAALRVGRDGNGAVVVFNTAAIPEWFPIAGRGYVARVWTDHQRAVHRAVQDLADYADTFSTADVATHPAVTGSRRAVLDTLHTLANQGVLDLTIDGDLHGHGYVWWPDGLHRLNPRGEVELPPVRLSALEDSAAGDSPPTVSYIPGFGVTEGNRPGAARDRRGEAVTRADDAGGGVADPADPAG